MQLPNAFIKNITHALGDEGRVWIDALPSLIAWCERDFGLTIGAPFELSYNYVTRVTLSDGTDAVLKLSPHAADFRYELTATQNFDGKGMVRLLEADQARGIAILERLLPGAMLIDLDDDAARTEIAADLMRELRRPPPPDAELPTTHDWFVAFAKHRAEYGGAGPLPAHIFERGEATYEMLLQSAPEPILLHGDLHHYNILAAQRAPWLAIDPHGLVGEPAFETGAYFGNPSDLLEQSRPERITARRADILAERLGYDRQRIVAWAFAYQVLSAVWSAERGGTGWRNAIGVAEILSAMQ